MGQSSSKSRQPSDAGDGSVEGAAELVHKVAPQERSNVCRCPSSSTGSDSAPSSQRGIGIWLFKRALMRESGEVMSARTDNERKGKLEELSPSISTLRVVGETCK